MKGLNRLKINIEELIGRYRNTCEENKQLREKIERLEKDLTYLQDKNQEVPEVILANKKILREREQIASKVENLIGKIEELNV